MMKKHYLIMASLLLSVILSAQEQFKYIRPSNTGLGGDYYNCLRVDGCGNKWTGGYLPFWSEGAVVRFDENNGFTCWSNFEGYIPADRVYDLAFDSNGGLWVATNGVGNGVAHGGITHFDGTTWTTWTSANSPLPYDDMRGIVVDHNDVVWATFEDTSEGIGGVVRFDGTNWTIFQPSNSTIPTDNVDKITVDQHNNIWVGTDDKGVLKYDGTTWTNYDNTNSGMANYIVRDVEFDASTNKLYAVTTNAVNIFDGANWTQINSSNAPISASGLWAVDARGDKMIITTVGGTYKTYVYNGSAWTSIDEIDHTYDARIDNDGNYWTAGNGVIMKYDGTTWTAYNGKNSGLTGMFNDDLFIDTGNRVWFASNDNGGINRFECPYWRDFNRHNAGLWPNLIEYTASGSGITEDSSGDIWMLYNGAPGGVIQVPDGNVDNPASWVVWDNSNSSISMSGVNRAAGDHSGNVWIGYDSACSVSKYSHNTNSWTNYNLYALGQTTCGAGSQVESIKVDGDNNVWVCGWAGLAKYDQSAWTFYSPLNTPMQQGIVSDIAFDNFGNKWIATEHGLYKFDGTNWTTYNDSNSGMFGNFCTSVLVDNAGVVWVGCYNPDLFPIPGGLCSFNGTTWTQYSPQNSGLQERWVDRMALDQSGNIWIMSAAHGASIFNPNGVVGYDCLDNTFQNCGILASNQFSNEVEPSVSFQNPVKSSVALQLNVQKDQSVSYTVSDITGKTVLKEQTCQLHQGNNQLTVDFSALQSGIYFCRLKSEQFNQTLKIVKE
jgi:ligand-binding sensor domain-containing protein